MTRSAHDLIGVVVIGAAGRMGRQLVHAAVADPEIKLAGAVEIAGHPAIGQDAGTLAGVGSLGVVIGDDLSAGLAAGDAVIDFSSHETAVEHARQAVAAGCLVVIGTTGLTAGEREQLEQLAEGGARIVVAPNMSVGVNVLFHLCAKVAPILAHDFDIEVVEMHHNQKKDAPSGTAVRLGEILAAATGMSYGEDVRHGRQGMVGARPRREIGMHAVRGGDVVGDHTVIFAGEGERIELAHKASGRSTFAGGAMRAVKFLTHATPGFYDMQDVLGLKEQG